MAEPSPLTAPSRQACSLTVILLSRLILSCFSWSKTRYIVIILLIEEVGMRSSPFLLYSTRPVSKSIR